LQGRVADQDLPRRGRGGELDRTPGGLAGEAGRVGTADQRLTRGQAAAHRQPQATFRQQGGLGVERAPGGQGRLRGAQGVVLVQDGDAEDAQDALAGHGGELPPMVLQGRPEDGQRTAEGSVERLRVQLGARVYGHPQLRAQHRHRLAHRYGYGARGAGLGRPKRGVLAQDRRFELAQGWCRLQAQLLGEQLADVTVDREPVGLAAAAVQREH
jgi:hypothetical protein